MVEISTTIPVPVDDVFAVLADGWAYASWVVAASHIRRVDEGWPRPGSSIHHSAGPWPLQGHDVTTVRAADPPTSLELDAALWPFGKARIRLELAATEPGVTEITMAESVVAGPGRILPDAVQALLLVPRNRESLARLANLARGRSR